MSNKKAKAERSKAKDARQMPAPDKKPPRKSKKKKPVVVEYRWIAPLWNWGREWAVYGRYRDTKTANKVIKDLQRKNPDLYELRIKGNC